jgi:hypothetical protein
MKPREYCCCAIPIVNAGIYFVLIEQATLAILVGTLSIATNSIVGASTPSFAKWITAVVCYIAAAIQILGFIGVSREKPILFRRYLTLHGLITAAAFAVAAAWTILSGTRHSQAQTKCEQDFFESESGSIATEGSTLCNIFSWIDLGIMGALWVILAIMQSYMFFVASNYSKVQEEDLRRFNGDATSPLTGGIPMTTRDPWGPPAAQFRGHEKKDSSASDVSTDQLYPNDYNHQYPNNAYTQEPQPTPGYNYQYQSGAIPRAQPPFGESHG